MADKTLFSMQITQAQKDIIEYMIDFRYHGQASKAFYLNRLILEDAMAFLGLPMGLMEEFTEEDILAELEEHDSNEKKQMIAAMGEERYNELVEKYIKERVKAEKKSIKDASIK